MTNSQLLKKSNKIDLQIPWRTYTRIHNKHYILGIRDKNGIRPVSSMS